MRDRTMRPCAAIATAAAAHLVPSAAALPPIRHALGRTDRDIHRHIALTFDDGPSPASTPQVLDRLARMHVRATFFVLGAAAQQYPQLIKRMAADGHDVAVHGWRHRVQLLRGPRVIARDMRRSVELLTSVTGRAPRYWRPPHGVPTGTGFVVARRLGLQPVLWSVDGKDWAKSATVTSVRERLVRSARPGAVVLLHDADTYSAPQSWRTVLAALPMVVDEWRGRGWQVGPLSRHGRFALPPAATASATATATATAAWSTR